MGEEGIVCDEGFVCLRPADYRAAEERVRKQTRFARAQSAVLASVHLLSPSQPELSALYDERDAALAALSEEDMAG